MMQTRSGASEERMDDASEAGSAGSPCLVGSDAAAAGEPATPGGTMSVEKMRRQIERMEQQIRQQSKMMKQQLAQMKTKLQARASASPTSPNLFSSPPRNTIEEELASEHLLATWDGGVSPPMQVSLAEGMESEQREAAVQPRDEATQSPRVKTSRQEQLVQETEVPGAVGTGILEQLSRGMQDALEEGHHLVKRVRRLETVEYEEWRKTRAHRTWTTRRWQGRGARGCGLSLMRERCGTSSGARYTKGRLVRARLDSLQMGERPVKQDGVDGGGGGGGGSGDDGGGGGGRGAIPLPCKHGGHRDQNEAPATAASRTSAMTMPTTIIELLESELPVVSPCPQM